MENRRTNPNRVESPGFPWRLFWLLVAGCLLGFAAALPYVYALFPGMVSRGALPMPLPVLVTVQLMQSTIVFGGIVALGIILSRKVGIEAPILHAWLYRTGAPRAQGWLRTPLLWGFAIGSLVLLLYLMVLPLIPQWPLHKEADLPVWQRFFVCLYGALNIELVMRFFLLSLFLWLFSKIARNASPRPSAGIFWAANVFGAVIYGLGHLPAAKSLMMPFTPVVLTAVLLPAILAGLAFGYLTWKRGIEAGMLAHFSSDLVAHVLGPVILR